MTITIEVLGPVLVRQDGIEVPLPTRQVARLLAALAAWPDTDVPVESLVVGLWGDAPPTTAANTLQVHVSALRRAIGRDTVITVPGGYRLALPADAVDERSFVDEVAAAAEAVRRGHLGQAQARYAQALARWRGVPFDGLHDPRLAARRRRLTGLRDAAREEVLACRLELARDAAELAVVGAETAALLAEDPLRERRHVLRVRALAAAGSTGQAVEAYRAATRTLREELGLDPGPALAEAYAALLRQDPSLQPRASRGRVRIPSLLSELVDRDAELAAIRDALLGGSARLTTLTGPAGSGTSRLAVAVAESLRDDMLGGIVVVELGRVGPAVSLIDAVVLAMGMAAPPGDNAREVATGWGAGSALLVLDDVRGEPDVAGIVALLLADERLSVLATARRPLGVAGERVFELGGLAVPPPGAGAAEIRAAAAVRLLLDRMAAEGTVVGTDRLELLAEVARRLDGLPLALELVAGRAGEGLLDAIAASVAPGRPPPDPPGDGSDGGNGTGGNGDGGNGFAAEPATGGLLADAVDRALAQLSPGARILAAAASQLPAGLSPAVAERLLGAPLPARRALGELVAARIATGSALSGVRLRDTVRARVAAGLTPARESVLRQDLRRALAGLLPIAGIGPDPVPSTLGHWTVIRADAANVRAAVDWPEPWPDPAVLTALAQLFASAVLMGAERGASDAVLEQALARLDLPSAARVDLLVAMGATLEVQGRFAEAEFWLRRAAGVAATGDDAEGLRSARARLAMALIEGGANPAEAVALLQASGIVLAGPDGTIERLAFPPLPGMPTGALAREQSRLTTALIERRVALSVLAAVDPAAAIEPLRATLAEARGIDVDRPIGLILTLASFVFAAQGLAEDAVAVGAWLRDVGEAWQDDTMAAFAEANEGMLALLGGDTRAAATAALRAWPVLRASGRGRLLRHVLLLLALIAEAADRRGLAQGLSRAALAAVPTDPRGSGAPGLAELVARVGGDSTGPDVLDDAALTILVHGAGSVLIEGQDGAGPAARPASGS